MFYIEKKNREIKSNYKRRIDWKNEVIVIFYTVILTRKVILWYFLSKERAVYLSLVTHFASIKIANGQFETRKPMTSRIFNHQRRRA